MSENKLAMFTDESNEVFFSLVPESDEEKIRLYNAMTNPDEKLSDHINQEIIVKDIICEMIPITSKETGEIKDTPRIILIDTEGKTYSATSFGVYNALKRIFAVYGTPTWNDGLKMRVVQISSKDDRKMLSIKLL